MNQVQIIPQNLYKYHRLDVPSDRGYRIQSRLHSQLPRLDERKESRQLPCQISGKGTQDISYLLLADYTPDNLQTHQTKHRILRPRLPAPRSENRVGTKRAVSVMISLGFPQTWNMLTICQILLHLHQHHRADDRRKAPRNRTTMSR